MIHVTLLVQNLTYQIFGNISIYLDASIHVKLITISTWRLSCTVSFQSSRLAHRSMLYCCLAAWWRSTLDLFTDFILKEFNTF